MLRGLTIILMLMNLTPGSWEHNYPFLVHAKWEGWTLIDMVAPAFLFCIGAAMPLSLERRSEKGDSRATLLRHVLWRGTLLVAIGLFLNLYPRFDFATFRIPGVLQRIGLCYMLTGAFMLMTARFEGTRLYFRFKPLAIAAAVILVSYWLLLYFVPVPGFGAPRFDPVGSWPPVIDRAVIGVAAFLPPLAGRREGSLRSRGNSFDVAGLLQRAAGRACGPGIHARRIRAACHFLRRRRRRDDAGFGIAHGLVSHHQEPLDQHFRAVQRRLCARVARRAHAGLAGARRAPRVVAGAHLRREPAARLHPRVPRRAAHRCAVVRYA